MFEYLNASKRAVLMNWMCRFDFLDEITVRHYNNKHTKTPLVLTLEKWMEVYLKGNLNAAEPCFSGESATV